MKKNYLDDMRKINQERRAPAFKKEEPIKNVQKKIISSQKFSKQKKEIDEIDYEMIPIQSKKSSRYGLWGVALISIIFLLIALSYLFAGANIVIHPKIEEIKIDDTYTASKGVGSGLSYDVVVVSGEEVKLFPAGEEKDFEDSAKGKALLYNNWSKEPQVLDINTRLEGSNGKIYKTDEKITIPGINADGNPGKKEVGIHASEIGASYNSDPLDFKILGFKGTPKYSKFYGRSVGSITGGMVGKARQLGEEEKKKYFEELASSLQEKLYKKSADQLPNGFLLYRPAVYFKVDEEKTGAVDEKGMISLSVKGTSSGVLIDEQQLTDRIMSNNKEDYDTKDKVYISNIKDLAFSVENIENVFLEEIKEISFHISGVANIVHKLDENKIIESLTGKSKSDFNNIMSGDANIESAELNLRPVWNRNIPDKIKNIEVKIEYP